MCLKNKNLLDILTLEHIFYKYKKADKDALEDVTISGIILKKEQDFVHEWGYYIIVVLYDTEIATISDEMWKMTDGELVYYEAV
mgnify:CR=1 FL=1